MLVPPTEVHALRSHPLRFLPLAAVALLASATVALAAGFDINGDRGVGTGAATGHTAVTACSENVAVDVAYEFVTGTDGAGRWVVASVDAVAPTTLGDDCRGWLFRAALVRNDGSAVETGQDLIESGPGFASVAPLAEVNRSDLSGVSILLVPADLTISTGEAP